MATSGKASKPGKDLPCWKACGTEIVFIFLVNIDFLIISLPFTQLFSIDAAFFLHRIFLSSLQEAFFGKDLLDTSRQNKISLDNLPEESLSLSCKTNLTTSFLDPSSDPLLSSTSTPAQAKLGPQGIQS